MENTKERARVCRVGEPDEQNKVYLEEECESWLGERCGQMMGEFQVFGLFGKEYRLGTQRLILVKKILEGERRMPGTPQLSTEVLADFMDTGRKMYPSLELVGWGVNQPGYGTEEVWRFLPLQEKIFSAYSVFLLLDGEKGKRAFYLWETDRFRAAGGYFLYKETERIPVQLPGWDETAEELWEEQPDGEIEVKEPETGGERDTTQSMRVLTSLASVLLLICLVMGMLLFNHVNTLEGIQNKINAMTQQLEQIHAGVFGGEKGNIE